MWIFQRRKRILSDTLLSYDMLQSIANNPEINLTEEELAQVDVCVNEIDLKNSTAVISYGADIQKKLSDISGSMLSNLNSDDVDDIGEVLDQTVSYLRCIEEEEGKFTLFKRAKAESMKNRYREAEKNIDKISNTLHEHQVRLMKDCAMLDQMYNMNTAYFRELNVKIAAGKRKLDNAKLIELPELESKAIQSGLAEDSQACTDFKNQIDRLEKKIYELELTRSISLQAAPQIRLIQSNQATMAEKLQSTLLNTIPLWKNQVVLALGMEHTKQAIRADKQISEMTNKLLLKNAETLKMASVETMNAANRGFVDVGTLEATNKLLIESLDEVIKIQQEGKLNRSNAELELVRIDEEMKRRLM